MAQTRRGRASLDANGSGVPPSPSKSDRQHDAGHGHAPASSHRSRSAGHQNWGARNALQIALFGVCAGAATGWALSIPPKTDLAAWGKNGLVVSGLKVLQAYSQRLESIRDQLASFDFVVGKTPLSSQITPVYAVLGYAALLLLSKLYVRVRGKPFDTELKYVVFGHNLFLSSLSAALLTAICCTLWSQFRDAGYGLEGLVRVWCDQKPHQLDKGRLIFFYYINYLTKYYELLDTALLVLRGKPVAVFHMYHHACTLVLCWSQLHDNSACQWVPIVLNLLVHVSMYYYYAVATLGRSVWWKKYLTASQIVQFAIDVPSCVLALLLRWNAEFKWGWFNGYNTWCRGTYRGAYFGIGLLFSYLILFIQLYIFSYTAAGKRMAREAAAKKQARLQKKAE